MKEVILYSDGACSSNPGPGGWSAILEFNETKKEFSRGYRNTTNNRMELMGIIEPLRLLKEPCKVTIYTDSMYIVNSTTKGWLQGWVKKDWKRSDKEPVANIDLWKMMLELLDVHQVHQLHFNWVKGHNEHEENERCDELAVLARQKSDLEIDTEYEKSL
jgi:ribonuclease HI